MTTQAAKPMSVKLDHDLRVRVEHLAQARQRSMHWVMREAIQQYVEHEEKREAFRQSGIRAWNEYQATGLHVSLDEADAWLARLEAGQEVEKPECHI